LPVDSIYRRMDEIALGVPEPILERLPSDDESAAADMQKAVAGWEEQLNRVIAEADDEREAAGNDARGDRPLRGALRDLRRVRP